MSTVRRIDTLEECFDLQEDKCFTLSHSPRRPAQTPHPLPEPTRRALLELAAAAAPQRSTLQRRAKLLSSALVFCALPRRSESSPAFVNGMQRVSIACCSQQQTASPYSPRCRAVLLPCRSVAVQSSRDASSSSQRHFPGVNTRWTVTIARRLCRWCSGPGKPRTKGREREDATQQQGRSHAAAHGHERPPARCITGTTAAASNEQTTTPCRRQRVTDKW